MGIDPENQPADTTEDEGLLLVRHCRGDVHAFGQLLQCFRKLVYGYIVNSGVSAMYCDDLFQDVFLKIHQNAARFDPAYPLKPWLFTIVVNTVNNHYRRMKLQEMMATKLKQKALEPTVKENYDDQFNALQKIIQTLPLQQRDVLLLTYHIGISQQEVATVLKLPVNTVKTHLRRARQALIKQVEQSVTSMEELE